jgi:hypothetical protein
MAGVIGLLHFGAFNFLGRLGGTALLPGALRAFSLVLSAAMGALFAWAASRFFVTARRSGELELLLPTPAGSEMMISAQWDVLKGLITGPVVVMLLPLTIWMIATILFLAQSGEGIYYLPSLALTAINLLLAVRALCLVGLWFGFRTGTLGRAIFWTVALVDGPVSALSLASLLLAAPFTLQSHWRTAWLLTSLAPQLARLPFYVWVAGVARRQLRRELSGAEPQQLRQIFSEAFSGLPAALARSREWGRS